MMINIVQITKAICLASNPWAGLGLLYIIRCTAWAVLGRDFGLFVNWVGLGGQALWSGSRLVSLAGELHYTMVRGISCQFHCHPVLH